MLKSHKVVVVGAGVGGVATAARLSKAGIDVTVVEKNSFVGGRCSLLHHEGYRFDQGPSLLLLPHIFRTTFKDLGTSLEEQGVDLLKCDPNYVVHFHDGKSIVLSTNLAVMKDEIEKWEGKDGFERYLAFLSESHRHYELSVEHVLSKNFTSILSMLRASLLPSLLALHPFDSIYTRASKYFLTDRLRRAFTFGSMYMGVSYRLSHAESDLFDLTRVVFIEDEYSPFESPGTFSLLQYTELVEGIWYPRGGFHKVVEALVNVSKSQGVTFRLSTAAAEVLVSSDHNVTGVKLSTGEVVPADLVIINADLVYSYRHLLPKSPPSLMAKIISSIPVLSRLASPTFDSLAARKPSCSSISFYWSMDRVIPQLGAHNVFLAEDYKESFDEIFKLHQMPSQPSFYVNVPSRIDASAAPEGKDSIVVLIPIGCLSGDCDPAATDVRMVKLLDEQVARAKRVVLRTLEERLGVTGIQDWIMHEIINTPITWRDKFNLDRGAILGLAHDFFNVLSFRPRTRHASINGLFFVGASTHPGTGVPICLSGAKITSEQVLAYINVMNPWANSPKAPSSMPLSRRTCDIDCVRPCPVFTTVRVIVLLILFIFVSWTWER